MDPVGIGAVAAVLVAGTAGGVWRSRTSGRLRDVPATARTSAASVGSTRTGAAPAGSVSAGSVSAGSVSAGLDRGSSALTAAVSASEAVVASGGPAPADEPAVEGRPIDPAVLAGLGVEPGERATLLQFSSAFCAPCRAVRRVSAEVAGQVDGVRHIEVDAEEHLDAVRALGIWRTPTLLVLDRDGRVIKRATGVPTKPHLIAALTEMA